MDRKYNLRKQSETAVSSYFLLSSSKGWNCGEMVMASDGLMTQFHGKTLSHVVSHRLGNEQPPRPHTRTSDILWHSDWDLPVQEEWRTDNRRNPYTKWTQDIHWIQVSCLTFISHCSSSSFIRNYDPGILSRWWQTSPEDSLEGFIGQKLRWELAFQLISANGLQSRIYWTLREAKNTSSTATC